MKIRYLVMLLGLLPCLANAAPARSGAGRTGMRSGTAAGTVAKKPSATKKATASMASGAKAKPNSTAKVSDIEIEETESEPVVVQDATPERLSAEDCREEYRTCMDEFCELDESEGGRCACSDNIKKSKNIIQSIQKIQEEAEKLYTEGVEKERLGAKAKYIFGESEKAKSRASRIDLAAWINGTGDDSMAADEDIGDNLYSLAADSCEDILKRCDKKIASKEEQLYLREVSKDCKTFDGYLAEQKKAAESNKNTAAAAVRSAKLEMFGTTNKYNRGECLLAYRACIADKGGCGVQFENCLDASLLQRRANACENVLDQCMATKNDVLADWAAESKMILADAAKYSDKTMRLTCNAKTQNCLEEGCSTSTDTMCLSDINVAAGICPIIDECNAKIPGFKNNWQDKLVALRTDFCQNDVTKCLQDKCGVNYDAPQCTGKGTAEIAALCPKSRFLSCKNEKQFNILVGAVLLKMNYQMLENCKNYYADALGRVCGTDMDCLTDSKVVAGYTKYKEDISDLQDQVEQEAESAVNTFFKQFETEKTITECASAEQPAGGKSLKDSMFVFAKQAAVNAAKKRYVSDLNVQHLKLARQKSAKDAEKACLAAYKPESRPEGSGNVTYIKSVSFEPSMMSCHVCRVQRVCQVGGESESTGALKGAAGGLAAGASAGSMLGPWGTAIGAVIGGVGGGIMGANSSGEKEFCQEIESCEDVNTGSQI